MKASTWTISYLIIGTLVLFSVLLFNGTIDSRWVTQADNTVNHRRPVFDERRQKTNFLVHQKPDFNNLILGSSRTSYISSHQLPGKWFNYSCSGMYPTEYEGFVEIALDLATHQQIDTILMGLDFWATHKTAIVDYGDPLTFLSEAENTWELGTNYLTWDALQEGIKTVRMNLRGHEAVEVLKNQAYYTWPYLEKMRTPMTTEIRDGKIAEQLWYYENDVFGSGYVYDSTCLQPLKTLIEDHPNIHFILFNTPVSPQLEAVKTKHNRLNSEQVWLREIEKLNTQWFETDKSPFTDSMFFDSHHLKPWHYDQLVKTILHDE